MSEIVYNRAPNDTLKTQKHEIASFLGNQINFDPKTVESFGEEWTKFSSFDEEQLAISGREYFDLLEGLEMSNWNMLDTVCGSGGSSKTH
jgi:hypothetical protein